MVNMQRVVTCDVPVFVCSIADLRQNVSREHEVVKKKEMDQGPKASYGYGGKFGVEKDRMDKVRLENRPTSRSLNPVISIGIHTTGNFFT